MKCYADLFHLNWIQVKIALNIILQNEFYIKNATIKPPFLENCFASSVKSSWGIFASIATITIVTSPCIMSWRKCASNSWTSFLLSDRSKLKCKEIRKWKRSACTVSLKGIKPEENFPWFMVFPWAVVGVKPFLCQMYIFGQKMKRLSHPSRKFLFRF